MTRLAESLVGLLTIVPGLREQVAQSALRLAMALYEIGKGC
jgi:hypothetical protein